MQCDEKSLRELLASSHGVSAVQFILDQLTLSDPLVVTMEDGAVMHLKRRHEVESLLVTLGCPGLLIRQVNRLRYDKDRDLNARLARLKKRWETTHAEHRRVMQETFSISSEAQTLPRRCEGFKSPALPGISAKQETSTPAGPSREAQHTIDSHRESHAG